jgi:hypothetical protein
MFNPFQKLEIIEAETFASVPAEFRRRRRTQSSDHNIAPTAASSGSR